MTSTRVFIGLGSNLGDSLETLKLAIEELKTLAVNSEISVSSFYQTQPVGPQDQPDYINAVAMFETETDAQELLRQTQAIEKQFKRERGVERWGPRTLDLDILFYGTAEINTENLVVPHPRMHERRFVLQPLLDLDANQKIPGYGLVKNCIKQCSELKITMIDL